MIGGDVAREAEGGRMNNVVPLDRWRIVERKKGSPLVYRGEDQVQGVHGEEIYVAPD